MKLRWKEALVAFLMAVFLWYGVSGSEKVESQLEVRVDYRGLPQDLIVREGLVSRATVRVQASIGMLRSMSGRDYTYYMDLSGLQKGENILTINPEQFPFRTGVRVIEVSPARITLDVDTITRKQVPLIAQISGNLPSDYVAQVHFTPPEVSISGASSLLAGLEEVKVPVLVEEPFSPGVTDYIRALRLPDGVEADQSDIKVSVELGIKRKTVIVTRSIQVSAPEQYGVFVRPDLVKLTIAVPESLAGAAASNKQIAARVRLDQEELGSYTRPVTVSLPEHAELLSVDPPQVSVTLEQKPPAAAK